MTTDYKVTELFCIIDEFCKHFDAENAGNLLEDNSGVKRRRRQASLSDSEIMTILLYFHFGTFRNFKHYYLFFIKGTMKSYFPKAVSYNRFVELESRVFFQLMFFLNLGAFGRCTGITFVDSTMIPVCHNLRRYANKVFKGIATDGKGTMGWCHVSYPSSGHSGTKRRALRDQGMGIDRPSDGHLLPMRCAQSAQKPDDFWALCSFLYFVVSYI